MGGRVGACGLVGGWVDEGVRGGVGRNSGEKYRKKLPKSPELVGNCPKMSPKCSQNAPLGGLGRHWEAKWMRKGTRGGNKRSGPMRAMHFGRQKGPKGAQNGAPGVISGAFFFFFFAKSVFFKNLCFTQVKPYFLRSEGSPGRSKNLPETRSEFNSYRFSTQ